MVRKEWVAIVLVVFVGFFVWGIFSWRAHVSSTNTNKLCKVLKVSRQLQLTAAQTPGTDAHAALLRIFPSAKAREHALTQEKDLLAQLPC